MNDEIKEILDKLKDDDWYDELDLTGDKWIELKQTETKQLLDFITNLQQKVEQYENPEDLTLFYMWLDEKAKYKMKELQKENERLKDELETMTFTAKVKQEAIDALIKRIDKVIELIEPFIDWGECTINGKILKQISDILNGDSDE